MKEQSDKDGEALRVLKELLPLAEAYLKCAPSDPRNTTLEDARALVKGHGIHYAKGIPLTYRERLALREAIAFRLSGEYEDVDANALRRAEKKL